MKNWKSTMAYIVFVGTYIFVVIKEYNASTIEVAGYIALYSSLFMMFRTDFTTELLGKVVDGLAKKK